MRFPTLRTMNLSFTVVYKVNLSPVGVKVTVLRTLTEQYGSGHEQNLSEEICIIHFRVVLGLSVAAAFLHAAITWHPSDRMLKRFFVFH